MRKKARIDLLEIEEPQTKEPETLKEETEEAAPPPRVSFFRRIFHWKFFLFVVLPFFCTLSVIGAVTYFIMDKAGKKEGEKQDVKMLPVSPAPVIIELQDLASVVSDTNGQERVVVFSLAVVPAPGKETLFVGEDTAMRSVAIRSVNESLFPDLLGAGGREEIKRRVQADLEQEKGAGSVHAVFITSWTVI